MLSISIQDRSKGWAVRSTCRGSQAVTSEDRLEGLTQARAQLAVVLAEIVAEAFSDSAEENPDSCSLIHRAVSRV